MIPMHRMAVVVAFVAAWLHPSPSRAEIPANWQGQLEVEQDIPRFSPAPGGTVAVRTTAKIPIRATSNRIEGAGTKPYRSDMTMIDCTGESTGEWTQTVEGTVGDALPSVRGRNLDFRLKQVGSVTHVVRCPRAPVQSVEQVLPEQVNEFSLPFADQAELASSFNFGGILNSRVTLHLPCAWDTRQPPGPQVVFRPDPRTAEIYTGGTVTTESRTTLTQRKLAQYLGGAVPPSLRNLSSVRGATEAPKWFERNVEGPFATPVKFGSGSCVSIDRIEFRLPPLRQFIAAEIAQRPTSQCRQAVVAHENLHRDANRRLLSGAANELERELRRISGPFDAELADDGFMANERLTLGLREVINAVEARYKAAADREHARIDDAAAPANQVLARVCRSERL